MRIQPNRRTRRHLERLAFCSGSMKPDTDLGGNVATLGEVFNGKTTSFVFNRI